MKSRKLVHDVKSAVIVLFLFLKLLMTAGCGYVKAIQRGRDDPQCSLTPLIPYTVPMRTSRTDGGMPSRDVELHQEGCSRAGPRAA